MCGIVGVMSNVVTLNELDHFYDLSAMATHRGRWGGGVVAVQCGKKDKWTTRVARTTQPLNALVASDRFFDMVGKERCFVLGHARWPTMGGNDIKAVHPHIAGPVIGVHNGTMHRVNDVNITKEMSDSAAVFRCIAEHGVETFVKKSGGAFALVWVNEADGTINFLRNNQRTLYFAELGWNGRTSTLYWASERAQLELVLGRHLKSLIDVRISMVPELKHMIFPIRAEFDVKPERVIDYNPPVEVRPHRPFLWEEAQKAREKAAGGVGKNVLALPRPTVAHRSTTGLATPLNAAELAKRALALLELDKGTEKKADDPRFAKVTQVTATWNMEKARERCCWCNGHVTAGDTIFNIQQITGQSEFICDDCISIPDVLEFVDPTCDLFAKNTRH